MKCASIYVGLLFTTAVSFAATLNVPAEFETVSAAIEAAENGDTVLVARGEYSANINFGGKAITVASNYLLTSDPDDIGLTILSAGQGSVVRFDHEENEDSKLIGFTLTGGTGSPDLDRAAAGGGIHCLRASPTLAHLIITDCSARYGAGIFLQHSSAKVSDCIIKDNVAQRGGGAIYCSRETSRPRFTRVLTVNSYSNEIHDIVGLYQGVEATFINCTFIGAGAQGLLGIGIQFYLGCKVWLRNCVMVPIQAADIGLDRATDTLFVDYSCLAGGREGIDFSTRSGILIEGDGYLESEPLINLEGIGIYSPLWTNFPIEDSTRSPLIDSGDPEFPEDPDGSRADIGAIPFNQNIGRLQGVVLSFLSGEPIAGAMIQENLRVISTSDAEGAFQIPMHPAGEFQLLVRASGFNDSLLTGLNLARLDTLELEIRLLNPALRLNADEYSFHVTEGTIREFPLELQNRGCGSLEYSIKAEQASEFAFKVGDVMRSTDLNDYFEADRFFAPCFIDGDYFIPGLSPDQSEKLIFCLSSDFRRSFQFPQPPTSSRYGLKSIVALDSTFWSCFADTMVEFDGNGEAIQYIRIPHADNLQYLTWDSDRRLIWVGDYAPIIKAFDPEAREVVDSLLVSSYRIYGLGYYSDDPDGYQLYAKTLVNGGGNHYFKIRIDDSDTMFVAPDTSSSGFGGCVVPNFDHWGNTAILSYNRHFDETRALEAIKVSDRIRWLSLVPAEGVIDAGRSIGLTITIVANDLIPEFYPMQLVIDHNADGLRTVVPINLTVTPLSVSGSILQPSSISLSAFPNPFNSSTTISFSVGALREAPLRLAIYDISGRMVADLLDGSGVSRNAPTTGQHKVIWDASGVGAGVYFVKLLAGDQFALEKIVLTR